MATFGNSSRNSPAGLLLLVAMLVGACSSGAQALLAPVSVSVSKLTIKNNLMRSIKATITAPAAAGEAVTLKVDAGKTEEVKFPVADPLTSVLKIAVYSCPSCYVGPTKVYTYSGENAVARGTSLPGFKFVVVRFCMTDDGKDGIFLQGYADPPVVDLTDDLKPVEEVCAPKDP